MHVLLTYSSIFINLLYLYGHIWKCLYGHKDMCAGMITAALFIIMKNICNDEEHELR